MTCKIYVCYHKPSFIVQSETVSPLHVGKEKSAVSLGLIGDNTGQHISSKNPYFCELTATYWIWKNVNAEIVGLFHYRRFLNFANNDTKIHKLTATFLKEYGITKDNVEKILKDYDLILPKKSKPGNLSIYEFYAREHVQSDMDLLINILKKKHPTYAMQIEDALKNNSQGHFANMIVAKKQIFDLYASWLFDILFEIEKLIQKDVVKRDAYQQRVYGFLAERMMGLFILTHPELKIKELPTIFVEEDKRKWRTYKIRQIKRKILTFLHLRVRYEN